MICQATVDNHCCWLPGASERCEHFDPALTDGYCSLRAELGSWQKVHIDARYAPQREAFERFGSALCGDFPAPGRTCGTCGVIGDG